MPKPIVNPDLKVHWDGPFLVVDNFLQNIDEFREDLFERGNFLHHSKDKKVVDVGPAHDWRQLFSSEDFPAEFNDAISKFQQMENQEKYYATNLFFSDMKISANKLRSSNYPHTDYVYGSGNIPIVFNLWLQDGGGGTGFYTYDGYYTSSAMNSDLRFFVENYAGLPNPDKEPSQYNSFFQGDGDWKLWKVAGMKKNRAFVYCGDFWHRVLIPENEFQYPNPRFSFVCFSSGPSSKFIETSGSSKYLSNNS